MPNSCFHFSGDTYLQRFKGDVDGRPCTFMTPCQVNNFMDRFVTVDEWIADVKAYFRKYNRHLLKDKRLMFVIESQSFTTTTTPARHMSVLVSSTLNVSSIQNPVVFSNLES